MADKIFCGSATKKEFRDGGHVINVSLEIDDLEKYFTEFGYINKAGKHFVKLKISQRREVGKHGETHFVEIDQWKPDQSYSGQSRQNAQQNAMAAPPRATERDLTPQERDEIDDARQAKMFPDDIPF